MTQQSPPPPITPPVPQPESDFYWENVKSTNFGYAIVRAVIKLIFTQGIYVRVAFRGILNG